MCYSTSTVPASFGTALLGVDLRARERHIQYVMLNCIVCFHLACRPSTPPSAPRHDHRSQADVPPCDRSRARRRLALRREEGAGALARPRAPDGPQAAHRPRRKADGPPGTQAGAHRLGEEAQTGYQRWSVERRKQLLLAGISLWNSISPTDFFNDQNVRVRVSWRMMSQ